MNQDILLSKIVPNPTDTTWAQAYTTLNVYITLSIEKETSKTPVTTHGKDILEKLQREFFALDEKSLENIKQAVSNVTKTIEEDYKYSIIVGAIVKDILYIIIASSGQVVIKRGEKVGVVASGTEGELHGFSGKLKHDDIIILETGDFSKKISLSTLSDQLASNDVLQIAETITPLIHGESKGTEGAIILQFKNMQPNKEDEIIKEDYSDQELDIDSISEEEAEIEPHENLWEKPAKENNNIEEISEEESDEPAPEDSLKSPRRLPNFSIPFPKINFANRKIIIGGIIVVLILLLVGGIYFQTMKADQAKKEAEFSKIYDPIRNNFNDAVDLQNLNKTLALDEFNQTLDLIKDAQSKFDESSSEYQKLSELKSQIESKISEIGGGGSAKNIKEFVKAGSELKSISAITAKGGALLILDSKGKQVATIKDNGSVGKTYELDNSADFLSADDKYIYAMGTGVESIDRGNGNVKEVMKKIDGSAFDIFGSNLYTLNDNDILKYKAPAYEGTSYFTDKPGFKGTPVDISIAGPIFVLESDGSIERFTKGVKDNFELAGLSGPIGEGAKIYADSNLDNVYVMDVKNQRVVVISEEGDFVTQYEGSFIKDATSFAIDEDNKIGYVLKSNTVYSFDL